MRDAPARWQCTTLLMQRFAKVKVHHQQGLELTLHKKIDTDIFGILNPAPGKVTLQNTGYTIRVPRQINRAMLLQAQRSFLTFACRSWNSRSRNITRTIYWFWLLPIHQSRYGLGHSRYYYCQGVYDAEKICSECEKTRVLVTLSTLQAICGVLLQQQSSTESVSNGCLTAHVISTPRTR